MSLRERTYPRLGIRLGIIEPCLPSPAKAPPSGPGWIHEIKHDGFRILARRDSAAVRLFTRNGNDFSSRFPFIATTVGKLPVQSCLIDGEAIVCDEKGLADFELIRGTGTAANAVHCAFGFTGVGRNGPAKASNRGAKGVTRPTAARLKLEYRPQCTLRGGWRDCVSRGVQARLRGYRVETARLDLSSWPLAALVESQKSECTSGEARGRGGLEPLSNLGCEQNEK